MPKNIESTLLGELVDASPMASKILLAHGLDFCCGGQRSLFDACKESSVDINLILQELQAIQDQDTPVNRLWANASNKDLIAHILDYYHASLYDDLPYLDELLRQVLKTHLAKDPERLNALKDAFTSFSEELLEHMAKEEQVLFPWILSDQEQRPTGPIHCMRIDHNRASRSLEQIATLTNGFIAPDEACASWRNLYTGLKILNYKLRMHIHLENNILFSRFTEKEFISNTKSELLIK